MSLDRLLSQAAKAGGHEVRLIPGRRIVILTAAGEREVQGAAQTSELIQGLLETVLTPGARVELSAGRAEWQVEIAGLGHDTGDRGAEARRARGHVPAREGRGARGRARGGRPAPAEAAPRAPRPKLSGPTAEIDELFYTHRAR